MIPRKKINLIFVVLFDSLQPLLLLDMVRKICYAFVISKSECLKTLCI